MRISSTRFACRYFVANITSSSIPNQSIQLESYTHLGEWFWDVTNGTNMNNGLESLEIVDRKGAATAPTYTTAVTLLSSPTTSTLSNGSFSNADINPAVAASIDELASHVCMGHIYVKANTTDGPLVGKLQYQVNDEGQTCEEAVGVHEEMVGYNTPAMAPSDSSSHLSPPNGTPTSSSSSPSMELCLPSLIVGSILLIMRA